ncbi:hypothetical protein SAMN05660690_4328 [Geodermatophilus telluris]|uniref:Uncharacterized protein n=1 Tax=Geodermatophilus telluris TaxID=1190417 RepID=A0A1G6V4N3_9ACTN|nr:hypothetical protein [Geodermatophilus telluris]SDD48423.1 hypothetical protein SAMN05660690_4328 [Geodermatophilus telluris]
MDGDRSAALVVRVWLEDGAGTFRGRLTGVDTSPGARGTGETTVALVSSPRETVEAVRRWLEAFLDDVPDGVAGGVPDPIDGGE